MRAITPALYLAKLGEWRYVQARFTGSSPMASADFSEPLRALLSGVCIDSV